MGTVATSVKLSEETARKLNELAARTGRSKSFYLRQAVEDNIDRLLWEYDLIDRAEKVRTGQSRTYDIDEVEDILGLVD